MDCGAARDGCLLSGKEINMLENHLASAITRRRLRSGPVADQIDAFADWLFACGYKPHIIVGTLRCLAR
jgi:hypothetical protein